MSYKEIIQNNSKHSAVEWWTKFAFHYTDISNIVNILSHGKLYSRTKAEELRLMNNDNASRKVIDITKSSVASSVRFYFRPLTPTQYYNEGYKHPDLRYGQESGVNVPLPVFLLFDLEKLLSMPKIRFSELAQSGRGHILYSSEDEFSKFNFDYIYSNGYCENMEQIKKFRHAEILFPYAFEVDSCLKAILCRNSVEQTTLLNLLKEVDINVFHKYKSFIKVQQENLFEVNGLYVNAFNYYHTGILHIDFSDTYAKYIYTKNAMQKNNISSLRPLIGRLELSWVDGSKVVHQTVLENYINYLSASSLVYNNLPKIDSAKLLKIRFFIEDKLMCFIERPLNIFEFI